MMLLTAMENDYTVYASNGNTVASLVGTIIFLAALLAKYMLFIKMGEEGWKSLIPFYSRYLLYKKCWKGSCYFVSLFMFIPAVILGVSSYIIYAAGYGYEFSIALALLAAVTAMVPFVMNLILSYRISRAFGHGLLFTVGYLLMTDIFTIILGFGDDQYQPVRA